MPTSFYRVIIFGVLGFAGAANSQTSQDAAAINAEKDRIVAETGKINAQKDRINAEADRDRARITSLGLPSFEGKTTLKDSNAGKLEAMLLASDALGGAVKIIATDAKAGPYLVLAGDENVDFSVAESMLLEVTSVRGLFAAALEKPRPAAADVAGGIAAISAVAGLLRSETEVSAIDLTASMPHRLLAAAVASQVNGYLPSAMIRSPAANSGQPASPLATEWSRLSADAEQGAATRKAMGDKPKDKEKAARLDHALARFKSLFDRATTANAAGIAPITAAIRLERLALAAPKVLRVHAEYTGGTFVSTKNLATMVGFDPMKVSGGVVVSYSVTDPVAGKVEAHHIINCRTALTSLRRVQAGKWNRGELTNDQRCIKVF